MASNKVVLTIALIVLISSAVGPSATYAITCGEVSKYLIQCIPYLKNGGSPNARCCTGASNLNKAANSKSARQQTCNCLKNLSKNYKGINPTYAKALPGACKIKVGYPIDPSVNCNSVS